MPRVPVKAPEQVAAISAADYDAARKETIAFWKKLLGEVEFQHPGKAGQRFLPGRARASDPGHAAKQRREAPGQRPALRRPVSERLHGHAPGLRDRRPLRS